MLLDECEDGESQTAENTCKRTIFNVDFEEDYFKITISANYDYFYSYSLKSDAIYKEDNVNNT